MISKITSYPTFLPLRIETGCAQKKLKKESILSDQIELKIKHIFVFVNIINSKEMNFSIKY